MPRIRTIKPEVWTDEKFGPLDPLSKLVYLGLISQADDAGRILDSVRLIDGALFPYDDSTTCRRSLDELSATGLIQRGETVTGQPVIQIVGWRRHQKIDKPNTKACLPEIASNSAISGRFDETSPKGRRNVADGSAPHTNDQRPTTNDQRAVAGNGITEALKGLYGWEGTEGLDPVLMKSFDDPTERDRCLKIAVARLEAEGRDYNQRYFRRVLDTVITEQQNGETSDDFFSKEFD